jgi:dTDP-4-amino-4,6-dideoxygalactose transaminase
MKNIPMVDLVGQYQKIKTEVDSAMQEVLDSAYFVGGPAVAKFQNELQDYLGVKHVIACGNGTDALTIAMMAAGLKPGDEVITANFTFVATAEAIAMLNLTPVLVDVEEDSFNMDISSLEKAITDKTKAIVPVHLFGQSANMEAIMEFADKHSLFVIEDTAQAIGADFSFSNGNVAKAGTIGNIGTTSFFPSKNLGCFGDGGALFTNDDGLAAMIKKVVNHGMEKRYYHDIIGMNSRLDTLQATVLSVKLKYLDDYCDARRDAADYYDNAFKGIEGLETPVRSSFSSHVFHQYTLRLSEKLDHFEMQNFLKDAGIPGMIYYPVPLHLQKAYLDPRYTKGDFPITEKLCSNVISLPMHTEHTEESLKYISEKVIEFVQKNS